MPSYYNFKPSVIPDICPICLKVAEIKMAKMRTYAAISEKAYPHFTFWDGDKFAAINMCYDCGKVLLKKIQEINPKIVAD
jgi:hypothetical protein